MRNKKGVTLVELLVVLVIIGITMGILYAVFFMNLQAFDQTIANADLGGEMTDIMDRMASDARFSKQIDVTVTDNDKKVVFTGSEGDLIAIYTMQNDGQFLSKHGDVQSALTNKLDFANSTFLKNGSSIKVVLTLQDSIFGHNVTLSSGTQIYPRNN